MSEQHKTILSDFTPICKLGEGSFSSVYKVKRNADGNLYALKKVKIGNLKMKQKQNALNEVRILASITSDHIIGYKQAFLDEKFNILCIVMQLANEGDLYMRIKQKDKNHQKFTEKQVWTAAFHIVLGIKQLHSNNILHRDLKSSNVFVSDGTYKLGDLNVSKVQNGSHKLAFTQTGTPYYASPQVWRDEPYDSKSDVWSYGCIIYEMCKLNPPFLGRNMEDLFQNIQKCQYEPIQKIYSKELIELVAKCLKKNPRERPNCTQILEEFKDKFNQLNISSQKIPTNLLKTIKYEENMYQLQKNLPQPKYVSRPQSQHSKLQQSKESTPMKQVSSRPVSASNDQKQSCKQNQLRPNSKNNYRIKNCGKIYKPQLPPLKQNVIASYQRKIQSANHVNRQPSPKMYNLQKNYHPKSQLFKKMQLIKESCNYNPINNFKPPSISKRNVYSTKSTRDKMELIKNISRNRSYQRNYAIINKYSNRIIPNIIQYNSNGYIDGQNKINFQPAYPIILKQLPRANRIFNRPPIREQLFRNQKILAENYYQRINHKC